MPTSPTTLDNHRARVRELINRIGFAMLVTHSHAGTLHGRPMATANVEEQWDKLWFATQRGSAKVDELAHDDRVCLAYSGSGNDWVSIAGRARLVDSLAKKRELWQPGWKNWFDGPEDPEMLLIEVTPEIGEYWDAHNRAVVLAKLALTAVTGKKTDLGDNEKVRFTG